MARGLVEFAILFALWLLWSGHTEPLILGLGVLSCGIVAVLSVRMKLLDHLPDGGFALRLLGYIPWLLWQIIVANGAVARIILGPALAISPRLVRVPAEQRTLMGQVTYANSITLTPGTVTLDLRDGGLLVHALTEETARDLETGEMGRRVSALEGVA